MVWHNLTSHHSLSILFLISERKRHLPIGDLWGMGMGMGKDLISVIHLCAAGLHRINVLCVCVRACACACTHACRVCDQKLGLMLFWGRLMKMTLPLIILDDCHRWCHRWSAVFWPFQLTRFNEWALWSGWKWTVREVWFRVSITLLCISAILWGSFRSLQIKWHNAITSHQTLLQCSVSVVWNST
jgi:hypothetical protein